MDNVETSNVITSSVKEELHPAFNSGSNQDAQPLRANRKQSVNANKNTNAGTANTTPSLPMNNSKRISTRKRTSPPRLRSSIRMGQSDSAAAIPGPSSGSGTRHVVYEGEIARQVEEREEMPQPCAKQQRVSWTLQRETEVDDSYLSRVQSAAGQILQTMALNRQIAANKLLVEDPGEILLQNLFKEMRIKLEEFQKTKEDVERRLVQVQNENEELKNKNHALQLSVKDLEIKILEKDRSIESQDHLRDSLATSQKNLTDREVDVKDWKQAWNQAGKEKARQQEEYEQKMTEKDDRIRELQKKNDELKAEPAKMIRKVQAYQRELVATVQKATSRTVDELMNLDPQEDGSMEVENEEGEQVNITP
ncbi:unnamed protein product [Orchesella dallaii]|uniref:Uncharacterized protein n=1 Tax=Orchesella dallaii TaxID=48710 RepID=A0ABP1S5M8_9HEXA